MPEFLRNLSLMDAIILFLIENIIVWILAMLFGRALVKIFAHRGLTENTIQFSTNLRLELFLSTITILTNTLITLAGFILWQEGIIVILPFEGGVKDLLDVFVLVMLIDLSMYLLHRIAHLKWFYHILHKLHHRFEEPTAVTLFSLHPFENICFGILWLTILSFYNATIVGVIVYLTLNVLFGIIGHSGVEPFPDSWKKIPVLKYISNGAFHVRHHRDALYNFGFYTNIWDRIFGTFAEK